MYYLYVLLLKNGDLYKGITDNIDRRLNQHQTGKVYSTKDKLPFILKHVEIIESRKNARELEKYFKSGFGREIIKEILDNLDK